MDLIVIGAGLAGSVVANKYATQGKKVIVFEKRKHVGGYVFDKEVEGIQVNMYGPHVFYTDDEAVNKYMNKFWKLSDYIYKADCSIDDQVVPLPFDFYGLYAFFPDEAEMMKKELLSHYKEKSYVPLKEIVYHENETIRKLGDFLYEKIYKKTSMKMYGKELKELDDMAWRYEYVYIGQGARFFPGKYQGIPVEGYTSAIKKMLAHKNIEVKMGENFMSHMHLGETGEFFYKDTKVECPVVFTGSIDEVFNYKYGALPFRSINFQYELLDVNKYQNRAVIWYPEHPSTMKVTEYKIMTKQVSLNKTVISKEVYGPYDPRSKQFANPIFPMPDVETLEKYNSYYKLVDKIQNFHLLGGTAHYRRSTMAKSVAEALELADKLLSKSK